MPILGDSGRLVLKREPGDPVTVKPDDLNRNTNSFMLPGGQSIWSGDKVLLSSDIGLPFYDANGVAIYQRGAGVWCDTTWEYAEGWKGIGQTDSVWCRPATPAVPWAPCPSTPTPVEAFAHVDQLGRVSFYPDYSSAVNGDPALRLPIAAVDFDEMLITSIEEPWKCICLIKDWSLELDAPAVDVTGLNTKFGENVKSLVTAGGEIGFMVELTADERIDNSLTLMRLLLMTDRGSKAQAQFWTSTGRTAGMCQGDCGELLPGDLYYEADVLVVGQALNLVPTEVVGGSVRFVATGPIALKISDNKPVTPPPVIVPPPVTIGTLTPMVALPIRGGVPTPFRTVFTGNAKDVVLDFTISPNAGTRLQQVDFQTILITFPDAGGLYTMTGTAVSPTAIDSPVVITYSDTVLPSTRIGSVTIAKPAGSLLTKTPLVFTASITGNATGVTWEWVLPPGATATGAGNTRTVTFTTEGSQALSVIASSPTSLDKQAANQIVLDLIDPRIGQVTITGNRNPYLP